MLGIKAGLMARDMTTLPFRLRICGLPLAALLICASIAPAPAQTAAATPADTAEQAPKRKKMVERAAAVMKAIGDASAKRGQKLPALADYYAAKADLKSIDPSAPEAPRAKKLLAAMQKNEREYVRKLGTNNINARLDSLDENVEGRKQFATETRKQMLRRGLSMDIGTSGEHETVLSYKYFKMDRPTVLSLARSGKIFDKARDLGFRSVIFTDGRLTWTYDVAANTFK
jgi:hypothetical protein